MLDLHRAYLEAPPPDQVALVGDGYDDGPVTFTRPGIDSVTVQVKGGKVSTTKAKRDWLLRHGLGVAVAPE